LEGKEGYWGTRMRIGFLRKRIWSNEKKKPQIATNTGLEKKEKSIERIW